jgi:hypothetical protein
VTKISGVVFGCANPVEAFADVGVPDEEIPVNVVAVEPIPDENEPRGNEPAPPDSDGNKGPDEAVEIS